MSNFKVGDKVVKFRESKYVSVLPVGYKGEITDVISNSGIKVDGNSTISYHWKLCEPEVTNDTRNKSKQAYKILSNLDYEYDLVKQQWYKKEWV